MAADPLSIAASVAGLVSVAAKILSMGHELCSTIKDAPESILAVIEEMRQMHTIFGQVQQLICGTSTRPAHNKLMMISIYNLQATLSGCVLLCDRLNRKLSEVLGLGSPNPPSMPNRQVPARDRVKWALWGESEASGILGDLQRHKLSLNLMLSILQSETVAVIDERVIGMDGRVISINERVLGIDDRVIGIDERVIGIDDRVQQLASLVSALLTVTHQILDSNPNRAASPQTISVQLQELIMRPHDGNLEDQFDPSISVGTTGPSSASTECTTPFPGLDFDDNASIRTTETTRSVLSMRTIRSRTVDFTEALNNSRLYKRLQRRSTKSSLNGSDTDSIFSISTGKTREGRWSMLSELSLGDLSISEISVLELPLFMSDMWDSGPYQMPQSRAAAMAKKGGRLLRVNVISSSRGRIHSAIKTNNEFVIRTLLRLGADVINEENLDGWAPLFHAAYLCRESICRLLLENGAGLLVPWASGIDMKDIQRVIWQAVGAYEAHVVSLQVLLAQAAMGGELHCQNLFDDFNLRDALTRVRTANLQSRYSRIDITSHLQFTITHDGGAKAVEILLALGADVEDRDEHGRTPLYNAACWLKEGVCKVLLEAGANTQFIRGTRPTIDITEIAQTDEHNFKQPLQTVPELLKIMGASVEGQLHRAIDTGKAVFVSRLLECGADIEELDRQGRTPLAHAATALQEDICELLLANGASVGTLNIGMLKGCIRMAKQGSKRSMVELLVKLWADIEELDQGRTPLAPTIELDKVIREQLNRHWDGTLNTKPLKGCKHQAIEGGSTRWMVGLLVKLGADIEEVDPKEGTPLQHAAIKLQEGTCAFLLDSGCRASRAMQLTPAQLGYYLHVAVEKSALKVAEVLLMIGADTETSRSFGHFSGTPLHSAASQGRSVAMIALLLDQGANISATTPSSISMLHFAVHPHIPSTEGLKYLLSRADMQHGLLNSQNNDGNTPLHWCAHKIGGPVHIEAAKLLIERGADLAIKNNNNNTPYQDSCSKYSANCEMAKFLWSKLTAEQQAKQGPGPTIS